jgi:hypothetical protein
MTTDTTTIPQEFTSVAEQAGLRLTRLNDGTLELSNTQGQGMLFTPDFMHEIPMWCANGGAAFKKRFERPKEEAATPDDDEVAADDEAEAADDDDEMDEAQNVSPLSLNLAHAIEALVDDLRDDLEYRIGELEAEVEVLQRKLSG